MRRIGVIGAGSWGTALANHLAGRGEPSVKLWVREEEVLRDITERRENGHFLPGIRLSDRLAVTLSIEEAIDGADMIVNVVPSQFVRTVFPSIADKVADGTIIVSASKGIEESSLQTVSGVLSEVLPTRLHKSIAVISGPSFAKEVALGLPTALCAASESDEVAAKVQQTFSTPTFRVYTNRDMIGVELGGALKNVIAIAVGISDGLGLGTNSRAALITRGLAEMVRLGEAMGADPQTFSGLSGLGDLVLTCTGDLSRNRSVGLALGRGKGLNEIVSEMKMVAEGVKTAKSVYKLTKKFGVDMPIVESTYRILYEEKPPKDAVMELMARGLRGE
ncbi:MAG: NAD(P)-dependent glycerol-3-phosphate dehydrogenase [Deltaproteobacteria bacterium]|nr:NAD(P)-dependent glycerol-3-phosphate dehydrogenase [Deltaproteobacteria bacterium]